MYALLLLISSINLFSYDTLELTPYVETIPNNTECYIGADIGGIESRFGIFKVKKNIPTLLFSLSTKTKSITKFDDVINDVIAYAQNNYNITINHACIAAPGVTTKNKDFSSVHNMFDIKAKKLLKKTPLKTAIIVNNNMVIGYGIDLIDQSNIIHMYGDIPQEKNMHDFRAIIGGEAGIGSSTISWDSKRNCYITHAGEAGLLEFSPTNKLEYEFANHIKNFYNRDAAYWANFASASGITRVYSMFKLMNIYNDSLHMDKYYDSKIVLNNLDDELCNATVDFVFKLFGRFTRNYVFSILPYGGLYITNTIATGNPELFSSLFIPAYVEPKFEKELKQIPIYLITDTNVSLYGAMQYLILENVIQQS